MEPVRDAASVILWRDGTEGPELLMGRRGAGAAFLPARVVFPGGAVEPCDTGVPLARPLPPDCARRLALAADPALAPALAAAAIRELWEEAGIRLSRPGDGAPPRGWEGFAAGGHRPDAGAMTFVFRAVTPPGRPRRYDARFFLVPASSSSAAEAPLAGSGELSGLAWVPIGRAEGPGLPFVTLLVVAEVAAILRRGGLPPEGVPFFDSRDGRPAFRRLL